MSDVATLTADAFPVFVGGLPTDLREPITLDGEERIDI
jgi:hypothetical protein